MDNAKNIIGNNIKILRNSIGLDQQAIARFLNVENSLISEVENGESNLSADMLEKLAYLFGVSVDAIENSIVKLCASSFAIKANELSIEELKAISNINRIALNSEYMVEIVKNNKKGTTLCKSK